MILRALDCVGVGSSDIYKQCQNTTYVSISTITRKNNCCPYDHLTLSTDSHQMLTGGTSVVALETESTSLAVSSRGRCDWRSSSACCSVPQDLSQLHRHEANMENYEWIQFRAMVVWEVFEISSREAQTHQIQSWNCKAPLRVSESVQSHCCCNF